MTAQGQSENKQGARELHVFQDTESAEVAQNTSLHVLFP